MRSIERCPKCDGRLANDKGELYCFVCGWRPVRLPPKRRRPPKGDNMILNWSDIELKTEPEETKVYYTWESFKLAIIETIKNNGGRCDLTNNQWAFLEMLLFDEAVHEPYSSGDILFALKKIKKVRKWVKC